MNAFEVTNSVLECLRFHKFLMRCFNGSNFLKRFYFFFYKKSLFRMMLPAEAIF